MGAVKAPARAARPRFLYLAGQLTQEIDMKIAQEEAFHSNGINFLVTRDSAGVRVRGSDNSYHEFNAALFVRVLKERRTGGSSIPVDEANHPLIGAFVRNRKTGETLRIRRVCRRWYCGYYLTALMSDARETQREWRIVSVGSSFMPFVRRGFVSFQRDFEILGAAAGAQILEGQNRNHVSPAKPSPRVERQLLESATGC